MKKINLIGLLLLSVLLNPKVSNAQIVIGPSNYVNGGGGTGPLHCVGDGTAALPCYTGSTVNSGIYFSGTSTLISANGVNAATFSTSGITSALSFFAGASSSYAWTGRSGISSPSDGVITLANAAFTDFTRLQFGGTSAVFASIKRNSTGIDIVNGDDSAFGPIRSASITAFGTNSSTLSVLGTTSTDGFISQNTTASTGGTPVQISPRLRFRGNAWDTAASETVDFFIENLPASAATPTGTLKFGYSLNGAAATYPMTLRSNGDLTTLGAVQSGNDASGTPYLSGSVFVAWKNATLLRGDTNGRLQISNNAITSGVIIDTNSDALMAIITRGGSDAATVTVHTLNLTTAGASMNIAATLQASLGTPSNGTIIYCSDCTIANPCAGGGTGAFAKRLNGVWVCN